MQGFSAQCPEWMTMTTLHLSLAHTLHRQLQHQTKNYCRNECAPFQNGTFINSFNTLFWNFSGLFIKINSNKLGLYFWIFKPQFPLIKGEISVQCYWLLKNICNNPVESHRSCVSCNNLSIKTNMKEKCNNKIHNSCFSLLQAASCRYRFGNKGRDRNV